MVALDRGWEDWKETHGHRGSPSLAAIVCSSRAPRRSSPRNSRVVVSKDADQTLSSRLRTSFSRMKTSPQSWGLLCGAVASTTPFTSSYSFRYPPTSPLSSSPSSPPSLRIRGSPCSLPSNFSGSISSWTSSPSSPLLQTLPPNLYWTGSQTPVEREFHCRRDQDDSRTMDLPGRHHPHLRFPRPHDLRFGSIGRG